MENQVTVLDFDSVYRNQTFLKRVNYEWIDLSTIPQTNLFCSKITLQKIAHILKESPQNRITLIGSGNYHYLTYAFLSSITRSFTLVLFDHHTDTLTSPSPEFISCGSWVQMALKKIPQLKKVIIVGVNEESEKFIPSSYRHKVRIYSKSILQKKFIPITRTIIKEIITENVYISIDKDVLDKSDAMTAWDHGIMSLKQLLTIVKMIMVHKQVDMIDICGEYPVSPLNEFNREAKEAHNKNSAANKLMIDHFQRWFKDQTSPFSLIHA